MDRKRGAAKIMERLILGPITEESGITLETARESVQQLAADGVVTAEWYKGYLVSLKVNFPAHLGGPHQVLGGLHDDNGDKYVMTGKPFNQQS